jgi:hypothetical protein
MRHGLLEAPARGWLLTGVAGGLCAFALAPLGVPLAILLLALAVVASATGRARRAWAAYLAGLAIMLAVLTVAIAVASPLAGGLLVAATAAALALGAGAAGLRRGHRGRLVDRTR